VDAEFGLPTDWRTYEGNLSFEDNGTYTVTYRSVDEAGNVEDERTVEFGIDASPPLTFLTRNASASYAGWYDSDVALNFSLFESYSGVNVTRYRVDGGDWTTADPNATVRLTTDGNHTVEYYSVDRAGNRERTWTEFVKIDTRKPAVEDTRLPNRTGFLPGEGVPVFVDATDDGNVTRVFAGDSYLGQGETVEGVAPAAAALGNHTLNVTVVDRAGNRRVVETAEYRVGRTVEMNRTGNGTLSAETDDANVGEVTIETENETGDASVTVGTATENPDPNGTGPEGASLYFPQINTTVPNDEIENATVTLTVDERRIRQQYVKPGTVEFWVEAKNGSDWRKVDARHVDGDDTDGEYTYEVDAPHFSTYAVTGETESAPPNVTAFGPEDETPTPGEVTISAEYGDDYSGVDPANVTLWLDGEYVPIWQVTDSGFTVTRYLTAGTYNATLSVTDRAGNSLPEPATVTFTVENQSSGGGGGGGGGGFGGGGIPEPSVQVSILERTADSLWSKVTSARSGSPGEIDPESAIRAGDVAVRSLTVRPTSDDAQPRFFVDANVTETPPEGRSAPDAATLGYLRVSTTYISTSALSEVGVRFAVPADAAAAPENVVLYRFKHGQWHALDTSVVDQRGGEYVLEASALGTGTFAVGVRGGSATETTAGDETTRAAGTTTAGDSGERAMSDAETTATASGAADGESASGGSIPGFGVTAALVALLAALLVARRRR
jgi:PGF-CTERM protein/PGF-pre-PGF domain-containing protein